MELRDFLTRENPLGPFYHERILRRTQDNRSKLLLCHVELFDQVLERQSPLIVGRRGSGKTAIVSAFLAASGRNDTYYSRGRARAPSRDFYVFINSWKQLDAIIERVGRDVMHSMGEDYDWTSVLPETVARHWSNRIWHTIFEELFEEYQTHDDPRHIRKKLPSVIKYITGRDFVPADAQLTEDLLERRFEGLRAEALAFFKTEQVNCYVVIDALDKYPIAAPRFSKLMSGFLKCINEFNDDNTGVNIICCLPEEVEPFFRKEVSNRIKEMSTAESVSKLRWRPVDLLRIVAERYRDFLDIHLEEDEEFKKTIRAMNFSERKDLGEFFGLVTPRSVINKLGKPESSLAYIIRHTQLLPREFILIFSRAIVASHALKGSWRYIEADAIVTAVNEQESELAEQILTPYRTLYPNLTEQIKDVVSELMPFFNKSDMDRLGGRLTTVSKHEVPDPWVALYDIGVIGWVERARNESTHELYEYGRFHYNSIGEISFANDRIYCVHPIFSGTWNLRQKHRDCPGKHVYPADVEHEIWIG